MCDRSLRLTVPFFVLLLLFKHSRSAGSVHQGGTNSNDPISLVGILVNNPRPEMCTKHRSLLLKNVLRLHENARQHAAGQSVEIINELGFGCARTTCLQLKSRAFRLSSQLVVRYAKNHDFCIDIHGLVIEVNFAQSFELHVLSDDVILVYNRLLGLLSNVGKLQLGKLQPVGSKIAIKDKTKKLARSVNLYLPYYIIPENSENFSR